LSTLLTIAVPVWNDQDGLKQTLASLQDLREFRTGQIDVVISDNGSDDDSWYVARDFASSAPGTVRVIRAKTNRGFHGNLLKLAREANSKYLWFIAAGEQITMESIAPLVDFLLSDAGSKVLMGTCGAQGYRKAGIEHLRSDWSISLNDPYAVKCFSEAISLNIINRELAREILEQREAEQQPEKGYWPHLEFALAAAKGHTFTVNNPPLIAIGENPGGWWYHAYPLALEVFVVQNNLLSRSSVSHQGTWWASELLDKRQRWLFAAFVFEITLHGQGCTLPLLTSARKSGVHLLPWLVGVLLSRLPRKILALVATIKNFFHPTSAKTRPCGKSFT
jgi:glycosyltransferase involved in cell wall biosynthesis